MEIQGLPPAPAGHAAASIYTVVENCRRHGIPVESYLNQLLQTLPGVTDEAVIASLTPARIANVRRRKPHIA